MVEAKAAVKSDYKIQYNSDGEKVSDLDSSTCGLPTTYKLLRSETVLFVDETGKNTSQKADGQIGGQRYIVAVDGDAVGSLGYTTDIHFTVLCFTAATGQPVMCAVILKSEKEVKDIPLSWRHGIDITKNLKYGENEIELFMNNSGLGEAMSGGPQCC
jgi:hypothetical protein